MIYGNIIILNGAPRSGKTSIVKQIQKQFDGVWVNIGVDNQINSIPDKIKPGVGLRPGGEKPELEEFVLNLYLAMYETIAVYSKRGFNVVVDVGHHEYYSLQMDIFNKCLKLLEGLPVYTVGVICDINEIIRRREATSYPTFDDEGNILKSILLWQEFVHKNKRYDLVIDTSTLSVGQCVNSIENLIITDDTVQ